MNQTLKQESLVMETFYFRIMRIAVNTRMLLKGKMEGIGKFTYEIFKRLAADHPETEFHFIFDRPWSDEFISSPNIVPHYISPPARHPFLWYLWYGWTLPRLLKKINPDIFVSTDGYLSLTSNIPSLAVIHDLNFEHFPLDLPFLNRKYYTYFFPRYARKATRIATVSKFTATDVINTYGINQEKIDIVYNGASVEIHPVTDSIKNATRQKFSNNKPYFLFIGALHQRKNIVNLLRAFDTFIDATGSEMQLVLAGQKRWWTEEMERTFRAMKYPTHVHLPGRIPDEDLRPLMASAFALTYVSTFEGFGIPIVEAMRCEVPVITSDVTSMPEIAGDAALLCNPFSVQSIAGAMQKIYSDEQLRSRLIEKGRRRKELFTWEKSAVSMWESIHKALSKSH